MLKFLAFNIPKEYHVNPFEKDFITNPLTNELTKKQRKICLLASLIIGIFTLGIYHLVQISKKHKSKESNFKAVQIHEKYVHVRPTKEWKNMPASGVIPDFTYVKPQVDLSSLENASPELKDKIEVKCLEKMKEAMKVLDPSIVDASNQLLTNELNPEFLETVNSFSTRTLDVYKAYVEIQIEQHVNNLPMNISILKAAGFSHSELLNLIEACKWYQSQVDNFTAHCLAANLQEDEIQILIEYIANNNYYWKTNTLPKKNDNNEIISNLYKVLDNPKTDKLIIDKICSKFVKNLNKKNDFFIKIKEINYRLDYIQTITQKEKESYKNLIAIAEPFKEENVRLRLLHEIQSRFELREFETGAVGSPLRLLNILEGKHDKNSPDQNYRNKLFFCYGSKGMINEISRDPEMVRLINEKLKVKNRGWQIDDQLAKHLSKPWKEPIFRLGLYANENNIGFRTRHYLSPEEVQAKTINDPNLTYAEAERIAKKENIKEKELNQRFRITLNESEEISTFGTTSALEKNELERRKDTLANIDRPLKTTESNLSQEKIKEADTKFLETPLAYKKKTQRIRWQPGKHFFQLHTKELCRSSYLEAVNALGIPQYSGISGSTEQTFTMAGILGLQTKEDMINLRLSYLPWMSGHEDHTVDEIMTATKSFGLEYKQSADYYKQILPGREDFIAGIEQAQRARGYELPDYYLSNEYVQQIYQEELQNRALEEAEQDKKIKELLSNHKLLMQTQSIYRGDYTSSDLFGDTRWEKNMQPLTSTAIAKKNQERAAKRKKTQDVSKTNCYALNFQNKTYEPYIPPTISPYSGQGKTSLSLIPSTGKITPYVEENHPHLNRVGLLYDGNECEFKSDKFVFNRDANSLYAKKWKKNYSNKDKQSPDFQTRLHADAEESITFLNTKAGRKNSIEDLVSDIEKTKDQFAPYNEILGSVKGSGIRGVFVYSKGLPENKDGAIIANKTERSDWAPLHHESKTRFRFDEDYDRYMLLIGIGKRISTRKTLGVDIPLYEINETANKGLSLISIEKQIKLINEILNDEQKIDGIVRIIRHQGEISRSEKTIKKNLIKTLKEYKKNIIQ